MSLKEQPNSNKEEKQGISLIPLYFVYDKDPHASESTQLLTILSDLNQLEEFQIRYDCFGLKNYAGYMAWAKDNQHNPDDFITMAAYSVLLRTYNQPKFYVEKVNVDANGVAATYRCSYGVSPLGASYEDHDEKEIFEYINSSDPVTDQELEELKEALEDEYYKCGQLLQQLSNDNNTEPDA